jgi:hypothetical protein
MDIHIFNEGVTVMGTVETLLADCLALYYSPRGDVGLLGLAAYQRVCQGLFAGGISSRRSQYKRYPAGRHDMDQIPQL